MNGLINFIIGYSEYACAEKDAAEILNALMENKIPFFGEYSDGETVRFCVLSPSVGKCEALCRCKKIKTDGLLCRLSRYKNRGGIVFGALFCVFCVWLSTRFVWDIEVEDKENEETILQILDDAGLKTGAYIPDIDEDIIEIKALLNTDEFSYISVTLDGTVAYVQTEKRITGVIPDDSTAPSNLVARCDGTVIRVEVHSGDAVCHVGQTVEKGELLISGFDETAHSGTKVVRAKGAVYANVERSFSVSCPVEAEEKAYTGRTYTQTSVSVCGIEAVFGKSDDYVLFDTETHKRKATVFKTVSLPIYITETVFREYEYIKTEITREEAEQRAKKMYLNELKGITEDAEVLYRHVTKTYEDGIAVISCELGMVCNIAKEEKIGVSDR